MNTLAKTLEEDLQQAIEHNTQQYKTTPILKEDCLAITGTGDSHAAAIALERLHPNNTVLIDPLQLLSKQKRRTLIKNNCTLTTISIGGKTKTLITITRKYRNEKGKTITITGNTNSPLAKTSHETIEIIYNNTAMGIGAGRQLVLITALAKTSNAPKPEPAKTTITKIPINKPATHTGINETTSTALYTTLKTHEVYAKPAVTIELEQLIHAPIYALPQPIIIYKPTTLQNNKRINTIIKTIRKTQHKLIIIPQTKTPWQTIYNQTLNTIQNLIKTIIKTKTRKPAYTQHPHIHELTRLIYKT